MGPKLTVLTSYIIQIQNGQLRKSFILYTLMHNL